MAYNTPGAFIEEVSVLPPSVAPVATAIPAFIGSTEFATMDTAGDLHLTPTRITSMVEYEKFFGGPGLETKIAVKISKAADGTLSAVATLADADRSKHLMWYALQLYFDNGGGPCYICSVGDYKAEPAVLGLTDGLNAVKKEDEPTLIVFPEAQQLLDGANVYKLALNQCGELKDRFVIMDVISPLADKDNKPLKTLNDPAVDLTAVVAAFRTSLGGNLNLKYGAAYAPNLETTIPFKVDESQTVVTLEDGTTPKLNSLKGSKDQAYNLAVAATRRLRCKLPPSPAIAGIYAAVDNARGVWKAPANLSLIDVVQPTLKIDDATQGGLNVDATGGQSINVIRTITGLGTLVWGARTLAGNDNEWRYINVRRFCIFAEESIRKATMQFVFEPNDAHTWVKVKGMIENFLSTQWRQGALQGVKEGDAYKVSIGLGSTMTALDVLEGRMIVMIGLCPVRPAEFIILRIVQMLPVS
jgi:phage tail sheath protein FI